MEVTEAIKRYVEIKAAKLPRFYDKIHTIDVTLNVEADKPSVEIVVSAKRKSVFVASQRGDDMYACVDQCLHKLSQQLRRHKARVRDHQGPSHQQSLKLTGQ
jgi:putative sigma-54 modulation protein